MELHGCPAHVPATRVFSYVIQQVCARYFFFTMSFRCQNSYDAKNQDSYNAKTYDTNWRTNFEGDMTAAHRPAISIDSEAFSAVEERKQSNNSLLS
eukprot:scaffold1525_cov142-Cylindrotheca_fusiformis.AAC.42